MMLQNSKSASKRKPFQVKKQNLLIIAALVWVAAGVNILHIGLEAYAEGYVTTLNEVLSVVVGLVFWFGTFYKLTKKHTQRITNYEEQHQYFWHFFDLKSFIIMAIMMTGGIALRVSGIAPSVFIAIFYTGLGSALALAGILFARNRIQLAFA
ncbi:putative membrane protein [Eggerthella sp. CAG:1427]|nr:putative membrane protein [Eggerthella sp. CAG:1427]